MKHPQANGTTHKQQQSVDILTTHQAKKITQTHNNAILLAVAAHSTRPPTQAQQSISYTTHSNHIGQRIFETRSRVQPASKSHNKMLTTNNVGAEHTPTAPLSPDAVFEQLTDMFGDVADTSLILDVGTRMAWNRESRRAAFHAWFSVCLYYNRCHIITL